MIRSLNIGLNSCIYKSVFQIVRGEKVVYSPAYVPFPGSGAHVPPGVIVGLLIEVSESIDKALVYEFVHPGSFFGQEAGIALVVFRSGQVYLFVGGVEIAADNYLFAGFLDFAHMLEESIIEGHLIFQALRAGFAVGVIDVVDHQVVIVSYDGSAFLVEILDAQAILDGIGLMFEIERYSAITAFFGMGEIAAIALRCFQLGGELVFGDLGLLNADYIRLVFSKPLKEAFFGRCSQAVDIPGGKPERFGFHGILAGF